MKDNYERRARVVNVVDGDTVDLRVDLGYSIEHTVRFRLLGINTPERGKPGFAEAKERVRVLLGDECWVRSTKTGKYGRWLCEIETIDGVSVNERLLAEGLAVVYGF